MASERTKIYKAHVNLTLTPEQKNELSDMAWANRVSMAELVRGLLSTQVKIRNGIGKNKRALTLFQELLTELNIKDGE